MPESEKDRRLARLQHEIEALRDYLRVAIEEHGAVQEELKSAHEEMLSANEEYQSTNEGRKPQGRVAVDQTHDCDRRLQNATATSVSLNDQLEDARLTAERARRTSSASETASSTRGHRRGDKGISA